LADEPTAHLDYIQVESVLRLLRELAEPGRIVVVATHDERLLALADRVVHLSQPVVGEWRPPQRFDCEPGQVVFEQGDRSDLVYTVEDGEVELVRQRADGTEEALAGTSASLGRCSACNALPPPGPSGTPCLPATAPVTSATWSAPGGWPRRSGVPPTEQHLSQAVTQVTSKGRRRLCPRASGL
jgi:energy-coupling factor transporter ATP-binding protein EcfA2